MCKKSDMKLNISNFIISHVVLYVCMELVNQNAYWSSNTDLVLSSMNYSYDNVMWSERSQRSKTFRTLTWYQYVTIMPNNCVNFALIESMNLKMFIFEIFLHVYRRFVWCPGDRVDHVQLSANYYSTQTP